MKKNTITEVTKNNEAVAKVTRKNGLRKALDFVNRNKYLLMAFLITCPMLTSVYGGEAKWNAVVDFFVPWIGRAGGAVCLFGGIKIGWGKIHDDPASNSSGIKWLIGGAIIIAVGASAGTFLS